MFAEVKAGQVIKEIKPGPFNASNGIQYPANIFSLWSVDELINIGIYPIEHTSNGLDHKLEYETGRINYVVKTKSVTKTKIKKDLDIDAVKTREISLIRKTQYGILSSTDWYYIRKIDKETAIPSNVQNYRDAVRDAGDKIISDITATTNKEQFQALYPVWNEEGKNIGGSLNIWPDPEDYDLGEE